MEGVGESPVDENPEDHGNGNEDYSDVTKVQKEFLNKLGLTSYFPEKITLQTAMENSSGKKELLTDLPWHFLTKMLMLDYRGRDDIISEKIKEDLNTDNNPSQDEEPENDFERSIAELIEDFTSCNSLFSALHPLDVLIAVFRCSSNFLRQILCEKMFMCKLSIPFLLPLFMRDTSMFLLWSLRNVILEFEDSNGVLCKNSVVKVPSSVVSFLRLGDISRSKSKFLNDILNSHSHPTFYNRDCKNGLNTRLFSDGLIEVSWHLPSKKNVCGLDKGLAFLNLRGDGISQETSRKFMCQVSDTVLVIVDLCALERQNTIDALKSIASSDIELILLLTKQSNVKFSVKHKEDLKNCIKAVECDNFKTENILFDFNPNGEKNIEALKDETLVKLSKCLAKKIPTTNFESFEGIAKSLHVNVDEDTPECRAAHKKASALVQTVRECSTDSMKRSMLPLQCDPWEKWGKLTKEEHRREKNCGDDLTSYMDKICNDKLEQRKEQLHLMKESHLFGTFLVDLLNSKSEERLYYLKWLTLYLDDLSREILPSLLMECSFKWNQIRSKEIGSCEMLKLSDLKSEMVTLENKLSDSYFGLEHFIRETAQAYEAVESVEEKGSEMHNRIVHLPRIMAELMLHGYPLELMDGDSAHVPLLWIKAVLQQLRELIGEDKIFVLSVLGIQSSGKSTMLNTMFGLQFPVAAGRCTRGVYAQLVPNCNEYSSENYKYILVIDTEGLRAAELGNYKHQHDNEIATLVIGLGDVTLVNIKGENFSEMEDVLQIVIHALLKMKLVNKYLSLQPSCFFIHQNVPAPDAAQQLRIGQQKFIETVDRVTKVAGKQEDAPQFTKFSQLIDFDINTNISYFSDLWRGDPPMAPANPGYSENVNEVKQRLLTDIMEKSASNLTIRKFSTKLKDLWNGILDQNFVFSFKNNLEMEAYSSLDDKLSDILWSLKKAALEWQSDKDNEIVSSDRGTEELLSSLTSECFCHFAKIYNEAKVKVQDFFSTDEDRSIIEQWRHRTFKKLDYCYTDTIRSTNDAINLKLKARQIQIDQEKDIQMYQDNLIKEATNVAEYLKLMENGQNLDDEKLEYYFNEIWQAWITKLPQNSQDNINIEDRINTILCRYFYQDQAMVTQALDDMRMEHEHTIQRNFENAMDNCVTSSFMYIFPTQVKKKNKVKYREKLFTDINGFVDDRQNRCFKGDDAKSLLQIASDTIKEMIDSGFRIDDIEEFRICVAICTCQYASYAYSRKGKMDVVIDGEYKLSNFGIHPYFEQELFTVYSSKLMSVLLKFQPRGLNKYMINLEKHVPQHKKRRNNEDHRLAEHIVTELYEDVELYMGKKEIQDFRDEYVEEIIKMVVNKLGNNTCKFLKKNFKIHLAVHLCMFTLSTFCEKHKRHIDSTNPRKVLKRDYYGALFQMFKNSYHSIAKEKALSLLLCERLSKAIEQAVDKDMARELADDLRHNVSEIRNKPAFLKAVLLQLLEEDNFEDFFLYLKDTNACFEKWIFHFIDSYLFSENGNNRYSEIASRMIASLLSKVCIEISRPLQSISEDISSSEDLQRWTREFQKQVMDKLPIPLHDVLSLIDGYDIHNLESFTKDLKENLQSSEKKIRGIFHQHTREHLRCAHEDSVYKIIFQECKGCTNKCPFCSSPCTLNTKEHIDDGIKHMAKEHYPQACGSVRWENTQQLLISNCSIHVASNSVAFKNVKTNNQFHLYKNYQEIYPDWQIDPDPSVEASPYWKWFLVKYESELAERYEAERPDIPSSWKTITKDMAKESAKKFTSSS